MHPLLSATSLWTAPCHQALWLGLHASRVWGRTKLGIKSRENVLVMGINKHNEECRSIVTRYGHHLDRPLDRFQDQLQDHRPQVGWCTLKDSFSNKSVLNFGPEPDPKSTVPLQHGLVQQWIWFDWSWAFETSIYNCTLLLQFPPKRAASVPSFPYYHFL